MTSVQRERLECRQRRTFVLVEGNSWFLYSWGGTLASCSAVSFLPKWIFQLWSFLGRSTDYSQTLKHSGKISSTNSSGCFSICFVTLKGTISKCFIKNSVATSCYSSWGDAFWRRRMFKKWFEWKNLLKYFITQFWKLHVFFLILLHSRLLEIEYAYGEGFYMYFVSEIHVNHVIEKLQLPSFFIFKKELLKDEFNYLNKSCC